MTTFEEVRQRIREQREELYKVEVEVKTINSSGFKAPTNLLYRHRLLLNAIGDAETSLRVLENFMSGRELWELQ